MQSLFRFSRVVLGAVVFLVMSLIAHNQAFGASEAILWSFGNGTDGSRSSAGLIIDASGNLYGTTEFGGAYKRGSVFKLTPSGAESVLWSFGRGADGREPEAGLIMDTDGNLYGTTSMGGACGDGIFTGGTVFELTPSGTESILWSFGCGADGSGPFAGLVMDTTGNLYGTTASGAANNPYGAVFKLTPPSLSEGNWSESILWNFDGTDGFGPSGTLIIDASGNLYGTTDSGGTSVYDGGTVFKLTPPSTNGETWTETVLWSFGANPDGYAPEAGLIMAANGDLYGTTVYGGAYSEGGTVFELTPPSLSGGNWSETTLWNFGSGADGFNPVGGLIIDASGNLYGTTSAGGAYSAEIFAGTAFELSPPVTSGGNWNETILRNFGNSGSDGREPLAGPLMDSSGNLYGTTILGGAYSRGTAFELSTSTPLGAEMSVTPTQINFPNTAIGSTSTAQVGVANTGNGQLIVTVDPPAAPFGLGSAVDFVLAPKTQATITLTFTPTSATTASQSSLVVSNAAHRSTAQLELQGAGTL
jgi:uncharacterized repeat protein (TIGR03803 family)